ncbi:MAG: RNA polymerase sigma factor [Clostridia bacterium]|nr:RNA polymerase sigma factor [Clostridia bacterium]
MPNEDALFEQLKMNDASALDALIRQYYPHILQYCRCHIKNMDEAEDAAQDTFIKAIRHIDHVHKGKLKPFLYKVATNVCIDYGRRTRPGELPENFSYCETGFKEVEAEIDFNATIEHLPQKQKEVIILRFVSGLKVREISEVMAEPMRTTQSRLRAALKRLKKDFEKGGTSNEP